MECEPAKGDHGLPFSPFSACIVPRPIGRIGRISADGIPNLAPFAFFNGVGHARPTVVPGPEEPHPDGGETDRVVDIDDAVIVDGRVGIERVQPRARLGYQDYATLGEYLRDAAARVRAAARPGPQGLTGNTRQRRRP